MYRSAVAARPDDVKFRAGFLNALKPFSFPGGFYFSRFKF